MLRRVAPIAVGVASIVLLASYVLHTRGMVSELRANSERSSGLYARIYEVLEDTLRTDMSLPLVFSLSEQIMKMGVPTVITEADGTPLTCINLPGCDPFDSTKAREAAVRLDRATTPLRLVDGKLLHFGFPEAVRALSLVPLVQAAALLLLLVAGFVLIRERSHSQRERLWAGMARESAHQIGTPLSSLSGWLQLLGDRESDEMTASAISHMGADLKRLERVAHRFERIGRPARLEAVDITALVGNVADYFKARVPTLAHRITIEYERPGAAAVVQGDSVLLEWALEALVKNSIDALAGRSGRILIQVDPAAEGGVRVTVADDGPGVNRDHSSLIFQPGFTTKEHGWGVGLSLTRRIVEETHKGELNLVPSDTGAVFEIVLH